MNDILIKEISIFRKQLNKTEYNNNQGLVLQAADLSLVDISIPLIFLN